MILLLDTCAFLWFDSDPSRLTENSRALLQDPSNTLLLSLTSLWEIQIKQQVGRLSLGVPLGKLVEDQRRANDVQLLRIELEHILALSDLPLHHRDPFDRLLIAQAAVEGAVLLTNDPKFQAYGVDLMW